jgi:hypothetical protein
MAEKRTKADKAQRAADRLEKKPQPFRTEEEEEGVRVDFSQAAAGVGSIGGTERATNDWYSPFASPSIKPSHREYT